MKRYSPDISFFSEQWLKEDSVGIYVLYEDASSRIEVLESTLHNILGHLSYFLERERDCEEWVMPQYFQEAERILEDKSGS